MDVLLLGLYFLFRMLSYLWHNFFASNVVSLALFCRSSRKAKAVPVAEEKDQKVDDEKEIDNGLVLLLRSIFAIRQQHDFNFTSQRLPL